MEFLLANQFIISCIIAVFIFLLPYFINWRFSKKQVASIVVTLGILGTFSGVFLGLLNFNPYQIQESIPQLIGGLKTAFLTSIAGLSTNLLIRLFPKVYGFKRESNDRESIDVGERLVRAMDRMTQSINGDDDSTLITQLQKIRTINTDGFQKMNDSFVDFADKMVADNTQSLIDALTQVMKDFNTQINEQFGDNFKRLNEAVESMVVWQDEYKQHVESLMSQFEGIEKSISRIQSSLEKSVENHDEINKTNEKLRQVISDFSLEVDSFASLGDKASKAFPVIEENMISLTQRSNTFINECLDKLNDNYDEFSRTQKELISINKREMEQMISDNAERIKNLDSQLGEELNKSLESLGSHLTSLSQHFVSDYQPLTEKLRNVVQIAKDLE